MFSHLRLPTSHDPLLARSRPGWSLAGGGGGVSIYIYIYTYIYISYIYIYIYYTYLHKTHTHTHTRARTHTLHNLYGTWYYKVKPQFAHKHVELK